MSKRVFLLLQLYVPSRHHEPQAQHGWALPSSKFQCPQLGWGHWVESRRGRDFFKIKQTQIQSSSHLRLVSPKFTCCLSLMRVPHPHTQLSEPIFSIVGTPNFSMEWKGKNLNFSCLIGLFWDRNLLELESIDGSRDSWEAQWTPWDHLLTMYTMCINIFEGHAPWLRLHAGLGWKTQITVVEK